MPSDLSDLLSEHVRITLDADMVLRMALWGVPGFTFAAGFSLHREYDTYPMGIVGRFIEFLNRGPDSIGVWDGPGAHEDMAAIGARRVALALRGLGREFLAGSVERSVLHLRPSWAKTSSVLAPEVLGIAMAGRMRRAPQT